VTHAGGITPMRRIADYAAMYQIKLAIHGPSDISPVGFAAALHLDKAVHNFGIQEFMGYPELTSEVFASDHVFRDGNLYVADTPGLRVDAYLEKAGEHPYAAAYLPVNRLLDGTLHDW